MELTLLVPRLGERVTFLTVDPVTFSRGSPLEGFFTGAVLKESSHRSLAATIS